MKNTTLKMMMIAITGLFLVSLNNVAHAEKKYYKSVPECVSWDNTISSTRYLKNNCGFGIKVWYCSTYSENEEGEHTKSNNCDSQVENHNQEHFIDYMSLNPYQGYRGTRTSMSSNLEIRYFACGADGIDLTWEDGVALTWNISGNTINSNRFRCYTEL